MDQDVAKPAYAIGRAELPCWQHSFMNKEHILRLCKRHVALKATQR